MKTVGVTILQCTWSMEWHSFGGGWSTIADGIKCYHLSSVCSWGNNTDRGMGCVLSSWLRIWWLICWCNSKLVATFANLIESLADDDCFITQSCVESLIRVYKYSHNCSFFMKHSITSIFHDKICSIHQMKLYEHCTDVITLISCDKDLNLSWYHKEWNNEK